MKQQTTQTQRKWTDIDLTKDTTRRRPSAYKEPRRDALRDGRVLDVYEWLGRPVGRRIVVGYRIMRVAEGE
jgi:hypothetical protein